MKMVIEMPKMWIMKITPGGSGNTKMYFENLFINEGAKNLIGYTKEGGKVEEFSKMWQRIRIGDLVIVLEGHNRVFGVVEIKSNPFDDDKTDTEADWFYHRRKAKLIKYFDPFIETLAKTNRNTIIEYSGDGAVEICDEIWEIIKEDYHNIKINENMENAISLLKYKKQIILQGPPGTGKTRMAKEIAERIIFGSVSDDTALQEQKLGESKKFKIIQFHPSYSYEDFVRGISTRVHEGSVFYETPNKTLLEFISHNNNSVNKLNQYLKYLRPLIGVEPLNKELNLNANGEGQLNIFQIDQLPEGEIIGDDIGIHYLNDQYRIWYNQILLLLNYWHEIKQIENANQFAVWVKNNEVIYTIRGHVKANAQAYFKFLTNFNDFIERHRHFVLIIDEINRANLSSVLGELIYGLEYRNNKIASPYSIDGSSEFKIPENLLIIGTMNTADRSVGHIDYAIRRRFAFVEVLPSTQPLKELGKDYFKLVASLFIENLEDLDNLESTKMKPSKYLAGDFKPEEVMIGHSYFITKENDENSLTEEQQIKMKMKYEVLPILKEYIKDGILIESKELREIIEGLYNSVA